MNLVLFGEDIFTATVFQSLLDSNLNVLLVVCPYYENNHHKQIKSIAERNDIEFIRTNNVNSNLIRNKLVNVNPDLLISIHLRKILSKDIFSTPKLGAINVHPSMLPKYRGLSPQHQAIIHGDSESAVTVHFIEEGIDTGDIIIQKTIEIEKEDYIYDFQLKMLKTYKTIVIEAIKLLLSKDFRPIEQNTTDSSYFGSLKRKDREIDLSKSKIEIQNLIRAVSYPYKGAFYKNYIIWRATTPEKNSEEQLMKIYSKIGIHKLEKDKIAIRLLDGVLLTDDFEITENIYS